MQKMSRTLPVVFVTALLSYSGIVHGAVPFVKERDKNNDGKVDERILRDDGRTTITIDRDFDGGFDYVRLVRTGAEAAKDPGRAMEIWSDDDHDGSFEFYLKMDIKGLLVERWRKAGSDGASCIYTKRDLKEMIETAAEVSGIGERDLRNVKTAPIPKIEFQDNKGSWWDHNQGLRVSYSDVGVLYSITRKSRGEDVDMDLFDQKTGLPRQVVVQTYHILEDGSRKPHRRYSLNDQPGAFELTIKGDGVYDSFSIEVRTIDGARRKRSASDLNRDGVFDSFITEEPDGTLRRGKDSDGDGLLDTVEIHHPDGTHERQEGNEIADRNVYRELPISYELIRAYCERVQMGPGTPVGSIFDAGKVTSAP